MRYNKSIQTGNEVLAAYLLTTVELSEDQISTIQDTWFPDSSNSLKLDQGKELVRLIAKELVRQAYKSKYEKINTVCGEFYLYHIERKESISKLEEFLKNYYAGEVFIKLNGEVNDQHPIGYEMGYASLHGFYKYNPKSKRAYNDGGELSEKTTLKILQYCLKIDLENGDDMYKKANDEYKKSDFSKPAIAHKQTPKELLAAQWEQKIRLGRYETSVGVWSTGYPGQADSVSPTQAGYWQEYIKNGFYWNADAPGEPKQCFEKPAKESVEMYYKRCCQRAKIKAELKRLDEKLEINKPKEQKERINEGAAKLSFLKSGGEMARLYNEIISKRQRVQGVTQAQGFGFSRYAK